MPQGRVKARPCGFLAWPNRGRPAALTGLIDPSPLQKIGGFLSKKRTGPVSYKQNMVSAHDQPDAGAG